MFTGARKKKREMDWQLVASYFTVKSTDIFAVCDSWLKMPTQILQGPLVLSIVSLTRSFVKDSISNLVYLESSLLIFLSKNERRFCHARARLILSAKIAVCLRVSIYPTKKQKKKQRRNAYV